MNPDSSQQTNRRPLIAGIVVIAILVLVIGGVSLANKDGDKTEAGTSSQSSTGQSTANSDTADTGDEPVSSGSYKSGTYEGSGTYTSPGGTEEVSVSLTLDGNTITDVNVTTDPASPTSQQYQGEFKSNYKSKVVGKNIDDVKLSKVSGSSLTSQGFNAALQEIKDQAKA